METEEKLICFSTFGEWTARDVTSLIDSVAEIYDVFSSYRVITKLQRAQEEALLYRLERYEKYFHHPMYHEWYMVWRDLIRDWKKFGPSKSFPYQMLPSPFPQPLPEKQLPEAAEIFENIQLYRNIVEELKIDRIHIASPGGFSFSGLGEVIQQFRELIKDLCFRNQHEKRKGELEIIEHYLRLRDEYPDSNLPPISAILVDRKMINKIQTNIENIRRLEREGKLLPIAENIEKRPE